MSSDASVWRKLTACRWRNLIDRSLPRQDLMEIAWHEVPVAWGPEIRKLSEPETPDEEHFVQSFAPQLQAIYKVLAKYRQTKQLSLVNTAYSDLYKVREVDGEGSGRLSLIHGEALRRTRSSGQSVETARLQAPAGQYRTKAVGYSGVYPDCTG